MKRTFTAEAKQRMSDAHRGVKFSAERRTNMKAAAQKREAKRRADAAKLAAYEAREVVQ